MSSPIITDDLNYIYKNLGNLKKFKNKNILITGPNAAGKTTLIKSVIINTIMSQQFACGFYEKGTITPYQHIHCYLNIPDTSGRDSLFQAEARRCKEILDTISEYNDDTHLCIFDELFSGTNPYEAVSSAFAYLEFLSQHSNVNFVLTTHFMNLCNLLERNKCIQNYYMYSTTEKDKIKYHYKMKKGVSKIKGGIHVLRDLDYPDSIVNKSFNIIETL